MVLPLSASLGRINPSSRGGPHAGRARMAGVPAGDAAAQHAGPCAGLTIVFSLTAGSYVTPQMVGGTRGLMLGVLLEQRSIRLRWRCGRDRCGDGDHRAVANVGVGWLSERHAAARLRDRSG